MFDRDVERADALAAELGDQALSASGDITDDGAIQGAIEAAASLGEIAVLVNVAGGGVGGGRLVARDGSPHDYDSFTSTMEMNATGTFNASRHIASAMGANKPDVDGQRGVIINTASIAGIEGRAGQVAYAAAKAAIDASLHGEACPTLAATSRAFLTALTVGQARNAGGLSMKRSVFLWSFSQNISDHHHRIVFWGGQSSQRPDVVLPSTSPARVARGGFGPPPRRWGGVGWRVCRRTIIAKTANCQYPQKWAEARGRGAAGGRWGAVRGCERCVVQCAGRGYS